MGIGYTNPPECERRLRGIDTRLYTRWNDRHSHLEVWFRPEGRAPYMVMAVQNDDGSFRPVDERTYSHLRKLMWINRNIVQYIRDQINDDQRAEEQRELRELEENVYMGRQIWPAFEALNRITGNSHTYKRRPHVAGFSGVSE